MRVCVCVCVCVCLCVRTGVHLYVFEFLQQSGRQRLTALLTGNEEVLETHNISINIGYK